MSTWDDRAALDEPEGRAPSLPLPAPSAVEDLPYELGVILTRSGRRVSPLALRSEYIDPEDIAHALACQNRFTGHAREPYSVAQHCVHVSDQLHGGGAPLAAVFAGLLHDATEAYLVDVASPIKNLPELAMFRVIEANIATAIEHRFGVAPGGLHAPCVKDADRRMLATEARDLMPPNFNLRGVEPYASTVVPWTWQIARRVWLERFTWLATLLPTTGASHG